MDFKEIEDFAKSNKPVSNLVPYPVTNCYVRLMDLYRRFKLQIITADVAAIEKKKYKTMFDNESLSYTQYMKSISDWQTNIRESCEIRSEINKAINNKQKIEDILALCTDCIFKLTGDTVLKSNLDGYIDLYK